jgi:hypothetical protein
MPKQALSRRLLHGRIFKIKKQIFHINFLIYKEIHKGQLQSHI